MTRGSSNDVKASQEGKGVIVAARFTEAQTVILDAAWAKQGFTNRSAFMRHAALVAAGEDSQSPAMIEAMRNHRRELGAVGRNINQLAFEMNRRKKAGLPVDPALLVQVEDLDAIRGELKAVAGTMDAVLKKAPKKRKPKA